MECTNVSESVPTDTVPHVYVKTVIKGKGQPGYFLTARMAAESALALVLTPRSSLPPLAQAGGILTPATAFGEILIDRLTLTKLFEFESKIHDA